MRKKKDEHGWAVGMFNASEALKDCNVLFLKKNKKNLGCVCYYVTCTKRIAAVLNSAFFRQKEGVLVILFI